MAESLQVLVEYIEKNAQVMGAVQKNLQGVDQQVKELDKNTSKMSSSFKQSWTEISSAIAVVQRGLQAVKKGYEFAKEGAQIEFTATKFDRLAESIGTTSEALMGDLQTATRGMYSDMELMASATDFVALGLAKDHEEAVRLSRVAAGLNMNMNQLVLTLTNMTTMRFDAIGVSVDGFKEKVKGLEESGLDANTAFKEAFLQQAENQLLRVGEAADSSAGAFMRFEASTKNLTDELKKLSAEALLPAVEGMNKSIAVQERTNQLIDEGIPKHVAYRQALYQIEQGLPTARDAQEEFNKKLEEGKGAFLDIKRASEEFRDSGVKTAATLEEAFTTMVAALYPAKNEMDVLTQRARGLNRAAEEAVPPVDKLTEEVNALADQAHNAAMLTGNTIAQLQQLDGMTATATVNINVNGSVPNIGGMGFGTGGYNPAGMYTSPDWNPRERYAAGGVIGAKAGAMFTVGEEGFEAGIVNKDGSITILPHKLSKELEKFGVLGQAPGFLTGGVFGSGGYSHLRPSSVLSSSRPSGRVASDSDVRNPSGGAGYSAAYSEETSVTQTVPVSTLTSVVTQEVTRMGSAMTQATVANVSATEKQTNQQERSNAETNALLAGIRSDLQRNRAQNKDDLREVLQGLL